MKSQGHKIIIITGASSGIGLATAKHLAAGGHKVYGIGRTPDFEPDGFYYESVDIRDSLAVNSFVMRVYEKEQQLDLLINNAGVHMMGAVECIPGQAVKDLFDTNFLGSLNMIRAILPFMKKQEGGMIICISSIGGITGLPFQGIYCASKFAIEGMCESLRMEIYHSGIHVVLLEPGDFRTPITQNRITDPLTIQDPFYLERFTQTQWKVSEDETNGSDPIQIAFKIEKIMWQKSPAMRYTAGKTVQRLVPFLKRILPSGMFQNIIRKNYYS